jgi:acetylornithine/succinyldiaminopimelate/putrescine aminotransferase
MNLAPPLIIKESQIDEMFDRIAAALDDAHTSLRERRLCVA